MAMPPLPSLYDLIAGMRGQSVYQMPIGYSDDIGSSWLGAQGQATSAALQAAAQMSMQDQTNRLRFAELMGADANNTPTDAANRWRQELLAQQAVQNQRMSQELGQMMGSYGGQQTLQAQGQAAEIERQRALMLGYDPSTGQRTMDSQRLAQEAQQAAYERAMRQQLQTGQQGWQTGESALDRALRESLQAGQQGWTTEERLGTQGYQTGEREATQTWQAGESALERDLRERLQRGELNQRESEYARTYILQEQESRRQQAELSGQLESGGLTEAARAARAQEAARMAELSGTIGGGGLTEQSRAAREQERTQRAQIAAQLLAAPKDVFKAGAYFKALNGGSSPTGIGQGGIMGFNSMGNRMTTPGTVTLDEVDAQIGPGIDTQGQASDDQYYALEAAPLPGVETPTPGTAQTTPTETGANAIGAGAEAGTPAGGTPEPLPGMTPGGPVGEGRGSRNQGRRRRRRENATTQDPAQTLQALLTGQQPQGATQASPQAQQVRQALGLPQAGDRSQGQRQDQERRPAQSAQNRGAGENNVMAQIQAMLGQQPAAAPAVPAVPAAPAVPAVDPTAALAALAVPAAVPAAPAAPAALAALAAPVTPAMPAVPARGAVDPAQALQQMITGGGGSQVPQRSQRAQDVLGLLAAGQNPGQGQGGQAAQAPAALTENTGFGMGGGTTAPADRGGAAEGKTAAAAGSGANQLSFGGPAGPVGDTAAMVRAGLGGLGLRTGPAGPLGWEYDAGLYVPGPGDPVFDENFDDDVDDDGTWDNEYGPYMPGPKPSFLHPYYRAGGGGDGDDDDDDDDDDVDVTPGPGPGPPPPPTPIPPPTQGGPPTPPAPTTSAGLNWASFNAIPRRAFDADYEARKVAWDAAHPGYVLDDSNIGFHSLPGVRMPVPQGPHITQADIDWAASQGSPLPSGPGGPVGNAASLVQAGLGDLGLGIGAGGVFPGRQPAGPVGTSMNSPIPYVDPEVYEDPQVESMLNDIKETSRGTGAKDRRNGKEVHGGHEFGEKAAEQRGADNDQFTRVMKRLLQQHMGPGGPVSAPLMPEGGSMSMPSLEDPGSVGGGGSSFAAPSPIASVDPGTQDAYKADLANRLRQGIGTWGPQAMEQRSATQIGLDEGAAQALGLNPEDLMQAYRQVQFANTGNALLA